MFNYDSIISMDNVYGIHNSPIQQAKITKRINELNELYPDSLAQIRKLHHDMQQALDIFNYMIGIKSQSKSDPNAIDNHFVNGHYDVVLSPHVLNASEFDGKCVVPMPHDVYHSFDCSEQNLKCLDNMPKNLWAISPQHSTSVNSSNGHFNCSNNKLTCIEGVPYGTQHLRALYNDVHVVKNLPKTLRTVVISAYDFSQVNLLPDVELLICDSHNADSAKPISDRIIDITGIHENMPNLVTLDLCIFIDTATRTMNIRGLFDLLKLGSLRNITLSFIEVSNMSDLSISGNTCIMPGVKYTEFGRRLCALMWSLRSNPTLSFRQRVMTLIRMISDYDMSLIK